VAAEELGHSLDDAGRVDGLVLEVLHDVEEVVVDLGLRGERRLDVLQVRQGVLRMAMACSNHDASVGVFITGSKKVFLVLKATRERPNFRHDSTTTR
jgi:hypothetical protein